MSDVAARSPLQLLECIKADGRELAVIFINAKCDSAAAHVLKTLDTLDSHGISGLAAHLSPADSAKPQSVA